MVAQVPVLDHPAEAELFADVLTCEAWLPAGWRGGDRQLPPAAGEALLRSIATAEDARSSDEGDERNELPQAFQRLEAKVDLMLNLIGRLARQQADALGNLLYAQLQLQDRLRDARDAAARQMRSNQQAGHAARAYLSTSEG